MNIFVTDPDPYVCANVLDDKRVVKMVLETAQLLSTAIHACGGVGPYKVTHLNHPCSIWTRQSRANYDWLLQHFDALLMEYTDRYGKIHKCSAFQREFIDKAELIPEGPLSSFVNCTNFKDEPDVFAAYWFALKFKWDNDKRAPSWHGNKNITVE